MAQYRGYRSGNRAESRVGRRRFIAVGGTLAAAGALGGACSSSNNAGTKSQATRPSASAAVSSAQVGSPAAATRQASPATAATRVGSPAAAAKQPKRGGSLAIRARGDPPSFSTLDASLDAISMANLVYNRLIKPVGAADVDPALNQLEPDLASKLPETPDQLTYIFTIRSGVKFQDVAPVSGRELTTEDVRQVAIANQSDTRSPWRGFYTAVDSFEAVDATTFRVKMKQPNAPFIANISGAQGLRVFPKELLAGDLLKTTPIGSGPYIRDSFQPGNRASYRRNPSYFKQGLPYIENLTMNVITADASAFPAYVAGQVNILNGPVACDSATDILAQKKGSQSATAFNQHPGGYIAFDTTRPPFNDVRVRRAISMAFNRKAESDALECGKGQADTFIPQGLFAQTLKIDQLGDAAQYWTYNPAEAKRQLAAAGFAQGFETNLVYTTQFGDAHVAAAERALADFQAVGIKVNAQVIDYNTFIASVYRPPFNFTGMLWGPRRYYPDIDPFLTQWLSPTPAEGIANQSRVNDPQISDLLAKQRGALDVNERWKNVNQIERIIADQQLYVARTSGFGYAIWESWLEGWSFRPDYDYPQIELAWDSRV